MIFNDMNFQSSSNQALGHYCGGRLNDHNCSTGKQADVQEGLGHYCGGRLNDHNCSTGKQGAIEERLNPYETNFLGLKKNDVNRK